MTTTTLSASTTTTGTSVASGDDGTLTIKTGATAGTQVNALSFAADGTPTFLKGPVASMVRLNLANGYGSANTMIRRFSNILVNQGTDITYADSATNGGLFTINTSGVYAIAYSDNFTAAGEMGLSLNSSQAAVAIGSITAADRLVQITTPAASFLGQVAVTLYLASGSLIRAHAAGVATGANSASTFSITRVA